MIPFLAGLVVGWLLADAVAWILHGWRGTATRTAIQAVWWNGLGAIWLAVLWWEAVRDARQAREPRSLLVPRRGGDSPDEPDGP